MDREQIKAIQETGYSWKWVSDKTEAKATYYKMEQGHIVPMPNLPADPRSLQSYLKRGFVLDPSVFKATGGENGLACPTCGKSCSSKLGLVSHMKSHRSNP